MFWQFGSDRPRFGVRRHRYLIDVSAVIGDPIRQFVKLRSKLIDRDIAEKARQCGADDYMGKPFEFDDLIQLVKRYARKHK